MNYEKTYKEALERAKEWKEKYGSIISLNGTMAKDFDSIFHELAESEDERIRKWLYNMVENLGYPADEAAEKELEEMQPLALAYLEKQKEQKPVECITDAEMEKGWDELTKFKQFASALSDMYNIIPSHSSLRPKDIDWNNFCAGLLTYLKKNQPAEWSEEDEKMLVGIIERGSAQIPPHEPALREEQMEWLMNRLKSLRPQIIDSAPLYTIEQVDEKIREAREWKPSDEQMRFLLAVINEPNNAGSESCHLVLKELYEQLKTL